MKYHLKKWKNNVGHTVLSKMKVTEIFIRHPLMIKYVTYVRFNLYIYLFVYFSEMNNAIRSLNGRYFGGRIVIAQRYDQDMYQANDLSG